MVLLFSLKYGKISAGTSINEKGQGKAALAMRPFTYGKYELFKNKDTYHINGAEVLKSYYGIGDDIDKYMNCAYALEFADKLLPDEQPAKQLFTLILDFFTVMEHRQKKYATVVLGYQVKALNIMGVMPQLDLCVHCHKPNPPMYFSIKDGGVICRECGKNMEISHNDALISPIEFDIVGILKYFSETPLTSFENLALAGNLEKRLHGIIKKYAAYYLDIGELKSESFLTEN